MSTAQKTKLATSFHDRRLAERLNDSAFKAEYERELREIQVIDAIVNSLDHLREQHGLTKAALARAIDKDPAAVRRLLTAHGNPNMRTVVAIADALDADVQIVPRKQTRARARKLQTA